MYLILRWILGGESHQSHPRNLMSIDLEMARSVGGYDKGRYSYRDTQVFLAWKQRCWGFLKVLEGFLVMNGAQIWKGEYQINWGIRGHPISPHQALG